MSTFTLYLGEAKEGTKTKATNGPGQNHMHARHVVMSARMATAAAAITKTRPQQSACISPQSVKKQL